MGSTTPMIGTSGVTPAGPAAMQMQTPTPGQMAMTPEQMQAYRWEREIDERNRYLSDDELDSFFPKEGYKVRFCSFTVTKVELQGCSQEKNKADCLINKPS